MADYYILLDANAPDLINILSECYLKHKQSVGFNRAMPEKTAHDGQTYFVKVSGVDTQWLETRDWSPNAIIWAFPASGEASIGYQVATAWRFAQCPIFYPNRDPSGGMLANNQERHDYWYNIWQDLINE